MESSGQVHQTIYRVNIWGYMISQEVPGTAIHGFKNILIVMFHFLGEMKEEELVVVEIVEEEEDVEEIIIIDAKRLQHQNILTKLMDQ